MPRKRRTQSKPRLAQPTRALSAISRRTTLEGHLIDDVDDGSEGQDLNPTNFVPIEAVADEAPDMESTIDALRNPQLIDALLS